MSSSRKPAGTLVLKLAIHRGLTWQDMPGRDNVTKRLTFATFRRGEWPPPNWKIPPNVEGDALRAFIEERLAVNRRKLRGG